MALLANVALTNTFDTWRLRTNALLTRVNAFTINESALYANTLTANVSFTSKGLATFNGRATVGTNLTVSGNTTLGAAGKTMTTTGAWSHTGTQSISTNLTVSGNTTFGPNILGLVNMTGRAVVGTNLTVSGNTTFGGAGKVSNTTGWFGVNGRASVGTNLFVGANTITMGRVGIGTSSPSYLLHLSENGNAQVWVSAVNAGLNSAGIGFENQGQRNWQIWADRSNDALQFGNNGRATVNMRISSGGLVTACNSLTVTQNLIVSGNTTLNGTTTDKSNALSQTLTDGATISWDTSLGRVATVTLGGARTLAAPTNLKVGTYILNVLQDATGSRTITWNSVFKWTGGVAPSLTTTANARDVFSFFSDGTNLYGSYLPDVK